MAMIADIEESNKLQGIAMIFLFLMLVGVFYLTGGTFLLGSSLFFDIGYLNVILIPFISTFQIFGIPLNFLSIGVFSFSIIVIWIFYGSTKNVIFEMNGTELRRHIKQGPMSLETYYDTAQFDYLSVKKTTIVRRSSSTSGSGYNRTSITTVYTLSATYKGTRVDSDKLYSHGDPDKVRNVANKISKAIKVPIQ